MAIPPRQALANYDRVREGTRALTEPLEVEDYVIQSMPDASPAKWHLAHTTWFFETFLLTPHLGGYRPLDEAYRFLFNSYYNGVGAQFSRPKRGTLSRPTVAGVHAYRAYVDQAMRRLLEDPDPSWLGKLEVGLQHEQQHQELLMTDIKHGLGMNPLRPAYRAREWTPAAPSDGEFLEFAGGTVSIGSASSSDFAFDNETPRHEVLLRPFRLAKNTVTAGEYLSFIEDGGYRQCELWLSDGWAWVNAEGIAAPMYWELQGQEWKIYTLGGLRPIDRNAPVCHISYYEADAFAQWANKRLPTEHEWEAAATQASSTAGAFLDDGLLHPSGGAPGAGLRALLGDMWEWTSSAYLPYPGFRPLPGTLGEYNGKFMSGQMVLRGGSAVTPRSHIRHTYRNFFPPDKQWQFSGIRLAEDAR